MVKCLGAPFQPNMLGKETDGIYQMCFNTTMACHVDIHMVLDQFFVKVCWVSIMDDYQDLMLECLSLADIAVDLEDLPFNTSCGTLQQNKIS